MALKMSVDWHRSSIWTGCSCARRARSHSHDAGNNDFDIWTYIPAYRFTQQKYIVSQKDQVFATSTRTLTPTNPLLQHFLLGQQLPHDLGIMPKNQPRPKQPDQHLHHLMTMQPRTLIPHQPALRCRVLVVLANVVLIRREHECTVAWQADLHEAETWRVARAVPEGDALAELEGRDGEGLPVEGGQGEVGGEVDAAVGLGCDGPGGVFEFFFVDVDCGGEEPCQFGDCLGG